MSADISTREGLFAVMRQIKAEREAAKPLVAELMSREELPWDEEIPEEWRTVGFVEELTKAVYATPENNPTRATNLITLAIAVASTLAESDYPSSVFYSVQANAFAVMGWIETYTDSFPEARRAYKAAQGLVTEWSALSHDRARLLQHQAGTEAVARRHDVSLQLMAKARELLLELDDELRLIHLDLLRGVSLYLQGAFDAARKQFAELLERVTDNDDSYLIGTIYNNLASTCVACNDAAAALQYVEKTREYYRRVGMTTDKPDWIEACALLVLDRAADAEKILREVRETFYQRCLPEKAAAIGLDIIEAMIVQGKVEEARQLTEDVIQDFVTAGMNHRLATALAYLRELLPKTSRPRAVIKHVQRYVQEGGSQPIHEFVRLTEPPAC